MKIPRPPQPPLGRDHGEPPISRTKQDVLATYLITVVTHRLEGECGVVSTKPLPVRAQRIQGRGFYACCLAKDHKGLHRWPEDGHIVEWEEP